MPFISRQLRPRAYRRPTFRPSAAATTIMSGPQRSCMSTLASWRQKGWQNTADFDAVVRALLAQGGLPPAKAYADCVIRALQPSTFAGVLKARFQMLFQQYQQSVSGLGAAGATTMVPAYTDISHFRAPYKNAVISGYGATDTSAATPPPPPAEPPAASSAFVVKDERGYNIVAPALGPTLMQTLSMYGYIFLGGAFNNVKIVPFTNEELAAAKADPNAAAILGARQVTKWIAEQVKNGNVVFMSTVGLAAVLSGQAIPEGADQLGTFPAGSQDAKDAAKSPVGVVIAGDPEGGGFSIAGLGPVGIALVAVAVVGGVYMYRQHGKSKRAQAARMSLGSRL